METFDIQQIVDYLAQSSWGKLILAIASLVTSVVICVVQLKKYFLYKKEANLKYRTENYLEKVKPVGQTFSTTKPEYKLDEKTNTLKQVGEIDLQALVQSSVECELSRVLDKYGVYPQGMLPKCEDSSETYINEVADDLLSLSDMLSEMEDIRERYGLSADMSYAEIGDWLADERAKNDKAIQSKLIKKTEKKEEVD